MQEIYVIWSGGYDSTLALALLHVLEKYKDISPDDLMIKAVSFDVEALSGSKMKLESVYRDSEI